MKIIRNPFVVMMSGLYIIACSSSQPEMQALQKPSWIQSQSAGQFLGVKEASSEDEARSGSRADALSQIRFSVYGGHVFSIAEMDLKEGEEGTSETYQQMSKLSVEGYVQGTALKTYVEQDFSGQDLVYRCYTLMEFDFHKYQSFLVEQSNIIEDLFDALQSDALELGSEPNPEKVTDLFQKINVTGSAFKAVLDASGVMNKNSTIASMSEQFRILTLDQVKKIQISPGYQSIVCNPFSSEGVHTPVQFRLKNGKPLQDFPIAVYSQSKLITRGKTDADGMVVLDRRDNWMPGDEINLRVTPDIPSLNQSDFPSVDLKLTFKYMLQADIQIDSKNIYLPSDDFTSKLGAIFDKQSISLVEGKPHGVLSGKISISPSSTNYGVFYTEAIAVITFHPDFRSQNKYEYTVRKLAEGRSYETAAKDAFNNVVKDLSSQIVDQLTQSNK